MGFSSCGGAIRTDDGGWLLGFCLYVGVCSILEAELWGIVEGLRLAWAAAVRAVPLGVDNGDVAWVVHDSTHGSGLHELVPNLQELLSRGWVFQTYA
ncbi:hypothetical protein V6N12_068947 [Hibiscus sabdariffa]|uniref:RNase H type-1 domain-containing protein n=1 Tax=Hibiscus sabdariffa TaxID=183260 RepID=A0ABR2CA93_9ROSI